MLERLEPLWNEATDIWASGGWAMIAIAVIALVMFSVGVSMQLRFRAKGFLSVPEDTWLFFALLQFPIYCLPAMLKPIYDRILPPNGP